MLRDRRSGAVGWGGAGGAKPREAPMAQWPPAARQLSTPSFKPLVTHDRLLANGPGQPSLTVPVGVLAPAAASESLSACSVPPPPIMGRALGTGAHLGKSPRVEMRQAASSGISASNQNGRLPVRFQAGIRDTVLRIHSVIRNTSFRPVFHLV